MTANPTTERSRTPTDSPVDDATYNVLMALASKLEAIDTYLKYESDGKNAALWQRLAQDDRKDAELLLQELKSCLNKS